MLKGNPPTFQNKLSAITSTGITKKFLDDKKIQIDHPEMKTYTRLVQRTRAVQGFELWDELLQADLARDGSPWPGPQAVPPYFSLVVGPCDLIIKGVFLQGRQDE